MLARLKKCLMGRSAPEPKSYIRVKGCRVRVQILGDGVVEEVHVGTGAGIDIVTEDPVCRWSNCPSNTPYPKGGGLTPLGCPYCGAILTDYDTSVGGWSECMNGHRFPTREVDPQ